MVAKAAKPSPAGEVRLHKKGCKIPVAAPCKKPSAATCKKPAADACKNAAAGKRMSSYEIKTICLVDVCLLKHEKLQRGHVWVIYFHKWRRGIRQQADKVIICERMNKAQVMKYCKNVCHGDKVLPQCMVGALDRLWIRQVPSASLPNMVKLAGQSSPWAAEAYALPRQPLAKAIEQLFQDPSFK